MVKVPISTSHPELARQIVKGDPLTVSAGVKSRALVYEASFATVFAST
jgi:hypothetical protein